MSDVLEKLAVNAIPREVARRKFRNWINYAANELKFEPTEIPKSIFIPIIDLINLKEAFQKFSTEKMSGIRIYFMRDDFYKPDTPLYLKCFVVPTKLAMNGNKEYHQDAIITIPASEKSGTGATTARVKMKDGGGSGDSESSDGTETIYNFTTSCPPDCDGTSSWMNDPV